MGLAWFFRRLRGRSAAEPAADPAEELRRTLDENRAAAPQAEPEPSAAAAVEPEPAPSAPEQPLDERRRAVHERGQAAIDRMRGAEQARTPDRD